MADYSKYKESAFTHEEMQPMIVETDMADMTDIVERLLNPANVFYEYAADKGVILREAADEIERLREALRMIADGDVPRQHVLIWRTDGQYSKHDKCPHEKWMYDDCDECVASFARAALGEKE